MRMRRARPGEAEAVTSLVRESLDPALRALTIWGAAGVTAHVEALLSGGGGPEGHGFYVADSADGPVGVAEFRSQGREAFLNHIYLRPSHRGAGAGRALLARGVDDLERAPAVRRLCLEVARDNERARAWYDRLGFRTEGERFWCVEDLAAPEAAPAEVEGIEEAERQHRRLGFSQLRLRSEDGRSFTVGRLGEQYYRLPEEARTDPRVMAALRRLDPVRRILVISARRLPGADCVRHTDRLVAGIAILRRRLAESETAGRGR